MVDDLDELEIQQDLALQQDRIGDLDRVVGERQYDVVRRVLAAGELFSERPAHGLLDLPDEVAQDVVHQEAFAVGQSLPAIEEEVLHGGEQRLAPLRGLVARELEENLTFGLAYLGHGCRPSHCITRFARLAANS